MSGALVGEVLAASERLRNGGLSERGFHALVAIAEKCHTKTRQGSVRWDHIRSGLYGASKRTAERAVADLKSAGLVSVVLRGFNNNHGRSCAPIYRIAPLTDTATQVSESPPTDTDKSGDRYRQIEDRYRHPGVVLDGPIDGPTDGEPSRYCTKHPNGTEKNCGPCGTARLKHKRWETEKADRDRRAREARAQARKDCNICGGNWYVLGADLTPLEPLVACPVCKPAQAGTA